MVVCHRKRALIETVNDPLKKRKAVIASARRLSASASFKLERLMPILLLVSTTVGGLIPLALFGGPLGEGMAYLRRLASSGFLVETSHAALEESLAPFADALRGGVQPRRDFLVLQPLGEIEHDLGSNDVGIR